MYNTDCKHKNKKQTKCKGRIGGGGGGIGILEHTKHHKISNIDKTDMNSYHFTHHLSFYAHHHASLLLSQQPVSTHPSKARFQTK